MQEIKSGIYVGYSEAQNNGDCYDTGITSMFPYSESAISVGAESGNLIGWEMTPEKLFVLFDFTTPTFVEKMCLETSGLSASETEIWGTALINVSCSDNLKSKYRMLDRIYPSNSGLRYEVLINEKVRFIKLEIKRSPWRAYPMPKVVFYGEGISEDGVPLNDEAMNQEFLYEPICVDEYGQAIFMDWSGKIYTDEQMKYNAICELKKYESFDSDNRYDKYGGIKGYKSLKSTGFFRVEKIDGVWWFVTPEGNPYIMKGVDLVCYSEISYHTPIYIQDTTEVRGVFEKLPDRGKYGCAYEFNSEGIPVLNFLKMNLYKKYGEDFDDKWVDMTKKRLADWGFNAAAKWDKHKNVQIPYVRALNAKGPFKKIYGLIDPYDEDFILNVENSVKDILPQFKDDPYLIGYHYTSECGFDNKVFEVMLSLDENCPMKKAFVKFISERISLEDANQQLNSQARDFEEMINIGLSIKNLRPEIISEFMTATAKIYYKTIKDSIKKYDPNHLYMGAALTPEWQSTYDWNIGGLEYLDVLSFDHYTKSTDHWIESYTAYDIPIINIEFSFTASDRGMSPVFDRIHCDSQKERGEEYVKFMKYFFSLPQFIGSGFFILNDQPLTGRCGRGGNPGECHNFGLIDITDEPYWDFIKYVKDIHQNLENIHANKKII